MIHKVKINTSTFVAHSFFETVDGADRFETNTSS